MSFSPAPEYLPYPPCQERIYLGSKDRILDLKLASQSSLPLEPLDHPVSVNALDGRFLAGVIHHIAPLLLVLSGNHHKQVWLNLIPSPCTPLVLGHFWLKKHNLQIDWLVMRVFNWSPFCHSSCFKSALVPIAATTAPADLIPPDLSSVPPEYHDLGEDKCLCPCIDY